MFTQNNIINDSEMIKELKRILEKNEENDISQTAAYRFFILFGILFCTSL